MKSVKETIRSDGYYDEVLDVHLVSVMAGFYHWTTSKEIAFSTTLGSCVSVCAYDDVAGIGGMNHFLLPTAPEEEGGKYTTSFRYGSAAIENMLNALYRAGAAKNGIRIKIFGGGKVLAGVSRDIGQKNIDFTRKFFTNEGFRIQSEDLGGDSGRRVIFFPHDGRALVRKLGSKKDLGQIATQERKILDRLADKEVKDDVELF